MPFKFRLRKTRHYNVISRNALALSVKLIDETTLECTLSADSTGLDCLQNVCQRLNLQQPEFFGLKYMSKRPYPKVRWVELERPLKKQLEKYAQSPALTLAIQYYIHDVGLLQDDVTRSQYFLQVKLDVLEGRLRCTYEQAIRLASYSLQAEFGDHQQERHTPEYLKEFVLFPKQIINEGDINSLIEAVVWQYSSLTGLGQALAETYYILEAQRLPGYGQETFIARDEKGCEIYLGASLMGIVIQPASGENQTFYRWNGITNLINHKRNFGIECSVSGINIHFTFEEPDAAKYVWKMCVKQHTFYKGNQDLLEGIHQNGELRSLAIPDLQSSVMDSTYRSSLHHSNSIHDTNQTHTTDYTYNDDQSRPSLYQKNQSHLEVSFLPKMSENTRLVSNLEASSNYIGQESFGIRPKPTYNMNDSTFSISQQPLAHQQTEMSQLPSNYLSSSINHVTPRRPQVSHVQVTHTAPTSAKQSTQPAHVAKDVGVAIYANKSDLPTSSSFRQKLLPQYRPAPDYDTAMVQNCGMPSNARTTVAYSSQPEISKNFDGPDTRSERKVSGYGQMAGFADFSPTVRCNAAVMPGTLHNTYSTPELVKAVEKSSNEGQSVVIPSDYHFIHGYKPPPPYPYNKPSSNSTPDLASASKTQQLSPDAARRRSLLTASLGCLGSPELSRTYENLADLDDAVISLRNELSRTDGRGRTNFLHSIPPTYSRDDLDAIYRLSNGRVAVGAPALSVAEPKIRAEVSYRGEEPIYQNIHSIWLDPAEETRARAESAPELDVSVEAVNAARQRLNLEKNSHLQYKDGPRVVAGQVEVASSVLPHGPPLYASHPQQIITNKGQRVTLNPVLKVPYTGAITGSQPHQVDGAQLSAANKKVDSAQIILNPANEVLRSDLKFTEKTVSDSVKASNVFPKDSILKRQTEHRGILQKNKFHLQVKDQMGNLGSCLGKENLKNKPPDILVDTDYNKMPSKDSRLSELTEKLHSMEIAKEFENIPKTKLNPDFTSALRQENITRNQYKDIVPYEETRVKITPSKENKLGYINASHITATVGGNQRFYICAQGPLANTLGHFWQCVWETDVRLVVMLTSVVGDTNTSKSFPYWPQSDNTSVECDQYRIYRKHSTKSDCHVTSRLQLVNVGQRKSRSVWHLQFTDWADHGCPEDIHKFITFLEELSTLRRVTYSEVEGVGHNRNTPVLVHCSAGVGRSGVTILCDLLLHTADHNLPIDVPKMLLHLRQQRMCVVQSPNQYKFVYRVLAAYLQKSRLI